MGRTYNVQNSFSINDPFSKIVELTFSIGRSGPLPRSWREYRFGPKVYRISEEQIGSTNPSGVFLEFRAEYSRAVRRQIINFGPIHQHKVLSCRSRKETR